MQVQTLSISPVVPFVPEDPCSLPALRMGWAIFTHLNLLERATARLVCRQWRHWVNNIHLVEKYNRYWMTNDELRSEATQSSMQVEQKLLLNIVKLAIKYRQMQTAAANAFMILKKIEFDFTNHSLSEASLEEGQVNQLPHLSHQASEQTRPLGLNFNDRQFFSINGASLYLLNLDASKGHQHFHDLQGVPFLRTAPRDCFLHFVPDSPWLFCIIFACDQGHLSIWKSNPLEQAYTMKVGHILSLSMLELTPEPKHLFPFTLLGPRPDGICRLEVDGDKRSASLKIFEPKLIEQNMCWHNSIICSFNI